MALVVGCFFPRISAFSANYEPAPLSRTLILPGAPPVVISNMAPRSPVVLGVKVVAIAHDEFASRLDPQADASRL